MSHKTWMWVVAVAVFGIAAEYARPASGGGAKRPVDAILQQAIERAKQGECDFDEDRQILEFIERGIDPGEAVPYLRGLLAGPNYYSRMWASRMLWKLGPAGVETVLSSFEDPDPARRVSALELIYFGSYSRAAEDPAVMERLESIYRRALNDASKPVRDRARGQLAYLVVMSQERECGIWLDNLGNADAEVAQAAALRIAGILKRSREAGKCGELTPEFYAKALERLLAWLEARVPNEKSGALSVLAELGPAGQPFEPQLIEMRKKASANSKEWIDRVLQQIGPSRQPRPAQVPVPQPIGVKSKIPATSHSLEGLVQALDANDLREEATEELARLGKPAIGRVMKMRYDAAPGMRARAIGVLGEIGRKHPNTLLRDPVLPTLVEMLGDNDDDVRNEAAKALGELGPLAAPVLPQFLKMYEVDLSLRERAIEPIAKIDRAAALPLLIDGLMSFRNEYYRCLCAKLLATYGREAEDAVPELVEMVKRGIGWDAEDRRAPGEALVAIVGRGEVMNWLKTGGEDRRIAAMAIVYELGTPRDLTALAALASDENTTVATAARELETRLRRRLFKTPATKGLAELLDDFRRDEVTGNADAAWRELHDNHYGEKIAQVRRALARTSDTQQRRALAMLNANDPMTTTTSELLRLVNDNMRAGSLAAAAHDALMWMIMTPMPGALAKERIELLRADEQGSDSQLARLAALALQFDPHYRPTQEEIALMAENLLEDGIAGNAQLAVRVLARDDVPGKRERLRKLVESKDRQAAGQAVLALVKSGHAAITPKMFKALLENLKLTNYYDNREVIEDTIKTLEKSRLPEKRAMLEAALRSRGEEAIFQRRVARLLQAMPNYEPSEAMIDFLISQLGDDGVAHNAWNAVADLQNYRSPMVIRKLERALESKDRQKRLWAADALPEPHEYAGGPPRRLIEVLLENLDDEDYIAEADFEHSNGNAKRMARYLAAHPKIATRELEASLDLKDRQRRWYAAVILGSTHRARRAERIAEILIPDLRAGGDRWLAGHALEGLGEAVKPYLEPCLNSPDPQLRENAELILEDIAHPPKTMRELYRRQEKYNLPDRRYIVELPGSWREWGEVEGE